MNRCITGLMISGNAQTCKMFMKQESIKYNSEIKQVCGFEVCTLIRDSGFVELVYDSLYPMNSDGVILDFLSSYIITNKKIIYFVDNKESDVNSSMRIKRLCLLHLSRYPNKLAEVIKCDLVSYNL